MSGAIKLPLNKGLFTKIDAEDFVKLNVIKWSLTYSGGSRLKKRPYASGKIKNKAVGLHRFLLGVTDKNIQVDHINGDSLDNRKCNLRICSPSENRYNTRKRKRNKSGFKGVHQKKSDGRYRAQIKKDYHYFFLGDFISPEDAARAYDAKAKELFGEFAYLNFPDTINQNEGVRP